MAVNLADSLALVAATVATVTFNDPPPAEIEVYNRGADYVWFMVNPGATDPTVGGDEEYVVGPGEAYEPPDGGATVKLISASAGAVTVTRLS